MYNNRRDGVLFYKRVGGAVQTCSLFVRGCLPLCKRVCAAVQGVCGIVLRGMCCFVKDVCCCSNWACTVAQWGVCCCAMGCVLLCKQFMLLWKEVHTVVQRGLSCYIRVCILFCAESVVYCYVKCDVFCLDWVCILLCVKGIVSLPRVWVQEIKRTPVMYFTRFIFNLHTKISLYLQVIHRNIYIIYSYFL